MAAQLFPYQLWTQIKEQWHNSKKGNYSNKIKWRTRTLGPEFIISGLSLGTEALVWVCGRVFDFQLVYLQAWQGNSHYFEFNLEGGGYMQPVKARLQNQISR